MSNEKKDVCECSAPGECPRFKRRMNKRMFNICHNNTLTPEKCESYRRLWDEQASNPVEDKKIFMQRMERAEREQPTPDGPGTELKKLLAKVGIHATPNCKCTKHMKVMNTKGPEWCEENIEDILDWLKEETNRRNLPFVRSIARRIVKYAIKRSVKKKLSMINLV